MGGSQSTRKISVDNENSIQVSQEALDRIQAQLSAKQAEQPSPPPPEYMLPPHYHESERRQQEQAAEEAYWAKRIESLKQAHAKISSNMQKQYEQSLKEANELFSSTQEDKIINKLPPCQEEKAKVLQCYSTNPNKSLLCSLLVNEFNDCVCKSRVAAVTAS